MLDKKNAGKKEGASGGRRFRLTDLFADSATPSAPDKDIRKRANELGVTLPPVANQDVIATANRVYDTSPRAAVLRSDDFLTADAPLDAQLVGDISYADSLPSVEQLHRHDAEKTSRDFEGGNLQDGKSQHLSEMGGRTGSMNEGPIGETVSQDIEQIREGMEEMYRVMIDMQERGDAQDKVFNTLHSELQDYKNDFIYEHLKPVVRPLLFLFDHMEQFDNELASQRNVAEYDSSERRLLSPVLVRENIAFFREQLVEALRICEVTPMKQPEGEVDIRLHKVVETVAVDASQHGQIQRTIRSGWYLNGRVFRHAEVIVGSNKELAAQKPLVSSTRSSAR